MDDLRAQLRTRYDAAKETALLEFVESAQKFLNLYQPYQDTPPESAAREDLEINLHVQVSTLRIDAEGLEEIMGKMMDLLPQDDEPEGWTKENATRWSMAHTFSRESALVNPEDMEALNQQIEAWAEAKGYTAEGYSYPCGWGEEGYLLSAHFSGQTARMYNPWATFCVLNVR